MNASYPTPLAAWLLTQFTARPELTQAELARAIGVSQQRISEWLAGRKRPRERNCIKLAQFFHQGPDAVLSLAGYSLRLTTPSAVTPSEQPPAAFMPSVFSFAVGTGKQPPAALIAVPIVWQQDFLQGEPALGYTYWDAAGLAGEQARGVRLRDDAAEFGLKAGDVVFIDLARLPAEGDVVAVTEGDRLTFRHHRLPTASDLDDRDARSAAAGTALVRGVVIGFYRALAILDKVHRRDR